MTAVLHVETKNATNLMDDSRSFACKLGKVMKILLTVLLAASALCLPSCITYHTRSDTYARPAGTQLNGAEVTSAVQPQGSDSSYSFSAMVVSAGFAKLEGPFRWRVEAEGKSGVHESMTVHRLKVITEKTKRDEWFPANRLGTVAFKDLKNEPGKSFAALQLPGTLEVYPEKDGGFAVIADVSIRTKSATRRKLLRFQMVRASEKDTDWKFIPAEIAKGWQQSPRDWQW